jgi:acyl-coenzyme A thioesterase PaaI-like protein
MALRPPPLFKVAAHAAARPVQQLLSLGGPRCRTGGGGCNISISSNNRVARGLRGLVQLPSNTSTAAPAKTRIATPTPRAMTLARRTFSQTAPARLSDKPDPSSSSRAHDAPTTSETGPETSDAGAPQPPKPRRRALLITAAVCLLLGTAVGGMFRMTVSPPPLPGPGTREDELLAGSIRDKAARLPIVKLMSSDPRYVSWEAYEDRPSTGPNVSIGSGPLSGSRGLAFQRVFLNRATGELVSVIYFGGALSGFPGLVHGGALAIVLDETLGRCAISRFPAHTGVTANLVLDYKRPTMTNAFYVVRCRPIVNDADEVVGPDGTKKSDRKLWVNGTIESLNGDVFVEAKALFVVPKGAKPGPMAQRW